MLSEKPRHSIGVIWILFHDDDDNDDGDEDDCLHATALYRIRLLVTQFALFSETFHPN